jgi:hypothetical protein
MESGNIKTTIKNLYNTEPKKKNLKKGKLSAFVGTLSGVDERTTKKDESLLRDEHVLFRLLIYYKL